MDEGRIRVLWELVAMGAGMEEGQVRHTEEENTSTGATRVVLEGYGSLHQEAPTYWP